MTEQANAAVAAGVPSSGDPDPEATLKLIQKMQQKDLAESGALDDWREQKLQDMDDDYVVGKPAKKKAKIQATVGSASPPGNENTNTSVDQQSAGEKEKVPSSGEPRAAATTATTATAAAGRPKSGKKVSKGAKVSGYKRNAQSGPSRGVSLRDLIKNGYLTPAEKSISVVYKDTTFVADLHADGVILFEGQEFESPSSWSIYVKRRVNPGKKADDGWKSVFYSGQKLEKFKHEYLKKMYGLSTGEKAKLGGSVFGKAGQVGAGGLKATMVPKKPKVVTGALAAKKEAKELSPAAAAAPTEPTAYAINRPKREVKKKQWHKVDLIGGNHDEGEHSMVPMEDFYGTPGSGEEGSQPFYVEISNGCNVVMDIHSYMSERHEIIGLLGGYFNAQTKGLVVEEAFPVRELCTEDNTINVEMDPESEVQVREQIKEKGMVCVGWYHSHPGFDAVPSLIDLKNQLNYQRLVRDEESNLEPFVAGIVSPYNPKREGLESEFAWFYVSHDKAMASAPGATQLDAECSSMRLDVTPR